MSGLQPINVTSIMSSILKFLIIIFLPFSLFAQNNDLIKRKDALREKGLFRNMLDHHLFGVIELGPVLFSSKPKNLTDAGGGTALRFYSNWYLTTEKKHRWFFRTNWIKSGVVFMDGILLPLAPLNIGIGDNFLINKNTNIEFSLSSGLILIRFLPISEIERPIITVYPEIKIQTKYISIGLLYSRHIERYKLSKQYFHYFSLSLSKGITKK